MNVRIITHRSNVWSVDGPPCDKHFHNSGHRFNGHVKFTITEKTDNASFTKQQRRSLSEHREDFLET